MTVTKNGPGFRLSTGVAAWVLLLSAGLTAPAMAQDAERVPEEAEADEEEDAVLETVVVSGFRSSLEDAIANKRNADTIIESITAEDIGRLPDISIAEALARLPGIASQRTNGQSSAINIRGLSQNLTFTTLNGREQVTPNGNRSIEFEQFPSELIAGADVFKSPKASLIEGGVGGTVELKTVRPLDVSEPHRFNVNLRGSFSDRADEIFSANEFGYRFSASYVGKFANNTLGVSLGYARLEQPDVSTRFVGFDFGGPDGPGGAFIDNNGDGTDDIISFGFEAEEQGGNETRDGVIGSVQWAPSPNLTFTVDGYYSNFESEGFGRGIRVIGPQEIGSGNTGILNPVFNGNTVIGGTLFRNVPAPTVDGGGFGLTFQNINDNQFDQDELISLGGNVAYQVDNWTASFDFTYSSAESFFANEVSNILPIVSLDGGVPGVSNSLPATPVIADNQTVSFLVNGVTSIPTLAFVDDFTDRSVQRLASFGAFPFDNDDELFAYAGDFEYRLDRLFGFLASVEVGVRYSEREATQFRESSGFGFGNDAGFFQFAGMPFTPIALTEANSSVECFSGQFAANGFPCFLVVEDPRVLFESENGPLVLDQSAGFTQSDSFQINEDVIAGYVQFNLDTQVGPLPVTGNIGLRIVNTDQSSVNQAGAALGPIGRDFTEFLPSANLIFRLTDKDQLRLGGSRAFSRVPITDLGAGVTVGLTTQVPEGVTPTGEPLEQFLSGGSSGNPFLDPIIANQFDVSYERYFDNGGIFTTAVFFKDLESVVFGDTITGFDFEAAGLLPLVQNDPLFANVNAFVGNFGARANTGGGTLWGIELAYTQVFDFLPHPLDGLGVSANYTFVDSAIEVAPSFLTGMPIDTEIPGFSEHVFNPTIFYDYKGFSNRVSGRYRSDFVSPQIGLNSQLPQTDDELVIDYQASYSFPAGSRLEGVTLLFQGNNLTDEPVSTFFGDQGQIGTVQFFGRQFFLGLSYAF